MMKTLPVLFLCLLIGTQPTYTQAQTDHDHDQHHDHQNGHQNDKDYADDKNPEANSDHDHEHEHQEQRVVLNNSMAKDLGITSAVATQADIDSQVILYGKLVSGAEQISHVRARYTGLIKSVATTVGERVKKGDLLARIESNDSLQSYPLLAPIDGVVIQRHANAGESTQDQVLFSIAQLDSLWAELQLFSTQALVVQPGQSVSLEFDHGQQSLSSTIEHIVPALNAPYQVVRVALHNVPPFLYAGQWVKARVNTGNHKASVAIDKRALQTVSGTTGVFSVSENKTDTIYTFTEVTLGQQNVNFANVTSGLAAGTRYAVNNSYLLKADLEKSAAEHVH